MTRKILVLDAESVTMLAVIRSLSQYGLKVIAISNGRVGGYASKYCYKRLNLSTFPSYMKFDFISKVIEVEKVNGIFAHSESTIFNIYKINSNVSDVRVVAPPRAVLELVTNKYKVLKVAERIGIKVPNTKIVTQDNLMDKIKDFDFPLFAKTLKEVDIPVGPGNRYIYVRDKKDLPRLKEFIKKHGTVIVQEYIEGFGCGIGGLFYNGKPVAVGGHRRVREVFKTGGPSTFAISSINRKALEYALRLMKELKYSGFGMVEFKVTRSGEPYLMEINPRTWGTFPLYIKSGLNLPVLAYKLFIEGDRSVLRRHYLNDFKEGVKIIYFLGDMKSIMNQYRGVQKFKEIVKDIAYLLLDPNTKEALYEWRDLRPFIYSALGIMAKRLKVKQ